MVRKGDWHSASVCGTGRSCGDGGELVSSCPKGTATAHPNLGCCHSFQLSKETQKSGSVHVQIL